MATKMPPNTELDLYRSIFDLSMVGAVHMELENFQIVWANAAFARILGYTPEEVAGKSAMDFTHPDDLPLTRESLAMVKAGSFTTASVDRRYRHRSGDYVWVNLTATVKRDESGRATHMIGLLQDISNRKRQEIELRDSKERLNSILSSLQDVVWSYNPRERRLEYLNEAATRKLYHREAADFFADPRLWKDVVITEDQKLVEGTGERLAERGSTEDEYRIIRPNGEVRWVHARAWMTLGEDGTPARFEGVLRDTTKRKNAELAIREKDARLRYVMEMGKIGLWEMNLITQQAKWSEVLREIMGVPEGVNPSPQAFESSVHPEDLDQYRKGAEGLMRGQDVFPPFRIVRADGTIRWVQNVGRVVRERDQILGVMVDITETRETEMLLQEQRAKMVAASKMSALGEMAGGLAHEINNPVAIIHGNALLLRDLAEDGEVSSDMLRQTANIIERTARRIARITKSLLAFARDAGQDPFAEAPLRLIVEETAEFCKERFRLHGIDFSAGEIDPGLRIECQSVQISQVLLNLLNNAHDAVEGLAERWIRIAIRDLGTEVELSVTDSGAGIPPELRERIFQPFFTTKDVGKGTGLGLSVASGIVESHGGKISVDAGDPRTRFVVRLPKKRPRQFP